MNIKTKKSHIWLPLLLAVLSLGCSKNTEDAEDVIVTKDYIVVDPPSLTANTTQALMTVNANCRWRMTVTGGWNGLSFNPTEYDGSVNVVVETSKNDEPDDRSCQLVFTNDDGTFTRTITLSQTAGDFQVELEVDPSTISAIASGEEKTFKVTCNTTWTVEVDAAANWCLSDKVNGNHNEEVKLTIQPNQTPNERVAQVKVSSGNRTSNHKEMVITVTQAAASLPAPVVTKATISADLTSISGEASFNSMYDVTEYGYCIGLSANPTEEHQIGTGTAKKGDFKFTATGLEDGRTYYIRAYAKSVVGTGYSEDYPVTIKGDIPGNGDNNSPNLTRK